MSKFTKGPWDVTPRLDVMKGKSYIAPISIMTHGSHMIAINEETRANARLIAAAPEMYELLKEELIPTSDYGGTLSFERERKVRELLARINGEEERHE